MRLTPWRWAWRALGTALVLIIAGWLVGGLLGLWSPIVTMGLYATVSLLVAAPWAVGRIGGAGLGAALLGLIAALGAGLEGHHAFVASRAAVVALPSLASWKPESGVVAMQVPALQHRWKLKASLSTRVSSGKGTRQVNQTAVPLAEADGRVVGFFCGTEGSADGTYALSLEAWLGSSPELCGAVIERAMKGLVEAGVPIEPGAKARVVSVFASEAALRKAHRLDLAFVVPMWMFVVYAVFVVLFRKAGAAPD
jgi:hypothetical protein